jgi:hypothetical protein
MRSSIPLRQRIAGENDSLLERIDRQEGLRVTTGRSMEEDVEMADGTQGNADSLMDRMNVRLPSKNTEK